MRPRFRASSDMEYSTGVASLVSFRFDRLPLATSCVRFDDLGVCQRVGYLTSPHLAPRHYVKRVKFYERNDGVA